MSTLSLRAAGTGFHLLVDDCIVLRHSAEAPAFFLGKGRPDVTMYRGNFDIEDRLDERIALRSVEINERGVSLSASHGQLALLHVAIEGERLVLNATDPTINRLWLRTLAEPGERVWGGGEQMSYFNMAGRRFPLWTSEPGVGRDKSTLLTFQADSTAKAGGYYWNTNYPQPTYVSSRHYALHVETTAYSCFDLRDPAFHEIEVWEVPKHF